MGWEVYPDGLYQIIMRLHREYEVPKIYVTENGAAFPDVVTHDGRVHDPERQAYLADYTRRPPARSRTARPSPATSSGRCSTTSSGARLREAIRARLRRLSDAPAHPEGQLPLVPRPHRPPARSRPARGGLAGRGPDMSNQYGRFDDAAREYVITRPDTPLPWLNYLGQDELFGLCTNTAGGYSFWRDARLRRLTRYRYNDVPFDSVGRYLYVNDGGTVWNPGWKPTKTPLDRYECRHGLGYTPHHRREGRRRGRAAVLRPARRERRDLEDDRPQPGDAVQGPHAVLVRRVLPLRGAERHDELPAHVLDRRGRGRGLRASTTRPSTASAATTTRCSAARGRSTASTPRAMRSSACTTACTRRPCRSPAAAPTAARTAGTRSAPTSSISARAGRGGDVRLRPRLRRAGRPAEVRAPFVVNKERGREMLARYADPVAVDDGVRGAPQPAGTTCSPFPSRPPRRARAADAQHLEPVPVHGDLQPLPLGQPLRDGHRPRHGLPRLQPGPPRLRPPDPRRARQRILDLAATQLSDGTCFHQYQPLTKKGNADIGGGFNDDPLWLILSTCAYIQRDGRRLDPRRAGRLRRPPGQRRQPAPPPRDVRRLSRSSTAARTGCR